MKKIWMLIIALTLFLGTGVFLFMNQWYCQDSSCKMVQNPENTGLIVSYDKMAFEQAQAEGKKVGLYFEANWCANCKLLKEDLIQKGIPENAVMFTVDFDAESDLRKEYEVVNLHTWIVFDQEGNVIYKDSTGDYDALYKHLSA